MTVNQLMLLLDIFRGTETQKILGSRFHDLSFLMTEKLIQMKKGELIITEKGDVIVGLLKSTAEQALANY